MIPPAMPANEVERQAAVERYAILDTLPEDSYDNITALMAYISNAPISLITILDRDRNFLKSHHGVDLQESPRALSFCGHAINSDESIMIIEDARKDIRFEDNPLVTEFSAIFYAGVPLVSSDGYKLGTLCLYDHVPRTLDEATQQALINMARQVVMLLEQRYQNIELEETRRRLIERNQELKEFASIVSHDIKGSVNTLVLIADVMKEDHGSQLDDEGAQWIERLSDTASSINKYVNGLLDYYTSRELLVDMPELLPFQELFRDLESMVGTSDEVDLSYPQQGPDLSVNRAGLMQILLNLLTNAIKYNDKPVAMITIDFEETGQFYRFSVTDNGMGIPADQLASIFNLFSTAHEQDRHGSPGTGIGLSLVRKLVAQFGGKMSVSSTPGEGSRFEFTLARRAQS
ncbi:MAG: GAF domain-containing sensor histidine kinase [Granulosicoccus sp.]|nr:GAF domain-containing sensor histidine kinase [Granulosicoccus sp.]